MLAKTSASFFATTLQSQERQSRLEQRASETSQKRRIFGKEASKSNGALALQCKSLSVVFVPCKVEDKIIEYLLYTLPVHIASFAFFPLKATDVSISWEAVQFAFSIIRHL